MPKIALDARLGAAAAYVRQEAYFADIGTDHALLPVFLLEEGRIARAIAADIGEGPLRNAAATVRDTGHTEEVTLVRTDGLTSLEGQGLTDIAICGMGGELIAQIIDAAPFVRAPEIRLILQPMSRGGHLRRYLAREGFAITSETLCYAARHLYACLCVHYTGVPYTIGCAEAELGPYNIATRAVTPLWGDYLASHIASARRRINGLHAGGESADEDERLLSEMEALL